MAKELERMGAHMLAIKDMAGLCRPYAAEKLVKTLREEVALPIHFHTHDTSGINAASILKAAKRRKHAADGAVASMSGQTSQPNLNSMVAALMHTERATGLDLDALNQYADYWEKCATTMRRSTPARKRARRKSITRDAGRPIHESEGAGRVDGPGPRWREIARTYADVNMAFGDIVKVTPSSKVVGDMAIFLVNHNMTMEQFEQSDAGPQSDAAEFGDRYVHGVSGRTGGRLAQEAAEDDSARTEAAPRTSRRASAEGRFG
jgi:pyruvate carboxylase